MTADSERLKQIEKQLREILRDDSAPILGPTLERVRQQHPELLGDPEVIAEIDRIRKDNDAVFALHVDLSRYPVLFSLLLTKEVAEGYSEETDYAVYPVLSNFLGNPPDFDDQKEKVCGSFREACQTLKLSSSQQTRGSGYIIAAFLHQVGLPPAHVKSVVEKLAAMDESALPAVDDVAAVCKLQAILADRLDTIPVARRAIHADATGYYVRTFLLAREAGSTAPPGTLMRLMADELARLNEREARPRSTGRLVRARVVWHDGQLAVELPAGEARRWRVRVDDGDWMSYAGRSSVRRVPVPGDLPRLVQVSEGEAAPTSTTLWEGEGDNRLLVFGGEGEFVAASRLNAMPLEVPPGEYTLVLLFEPNGADNALNVGQETDVYEWPVKVEPGKTLPIRRGQATLLLRASHQPWLSFEGASLDCADGTRIWKADGLSVRASGFGLTEDRLGCEQEIRILDGDMEIGRTPASAERHIVDGSLLSPGLHRIAGLVCDRDTGSPIVQQSALVWAGLMGQNAQGHLLCSQPPENLAVEHSQNVAADPEGLRFAPHDTTQREFRMAFRLPGRRKLIALPWYVPGTFLELETPGVDVAAHGLRPGALITEPAHTRKQLRLCSTEGGKLFLDGRFERTLPKLKAVRLPLATLISRLPAGEGDLFLHRDGVPPQMLIRISQTRQVEEFSCYSQTPHEAEYRIVLSDPCRQMHLRYENLLGGATRETCISCGRALSLTSGEAFQVMKDVQVPGRFAFRLIVMPKYLSPGLWLVHLEAVDGQRTRPLVDLDRRPYTLCLAIDRNLTLRSSPRVQIDEFFWKYSGNGARISLLRHVQSSLLQGQQHLIDPFPQNLWKEVARAINLSEDGALSNVVRLMDGEYPGEVGPTNHIGIEVALPEVFAQMASRYRELRNCDGPFARELRILGDISENRAEFLQETADPVVRASVRPRGQFEPGYRFDPGVYWAALRDAGAQHADPDRILGWPHYQTAWNRLCDRYDDWTQESPELEEQLNGFFRSWSEVRSRDIPSEQPERVHSHPQAKLFRQLNAFYDFLADLCRSKHLTVTDVAGWNLPVTALAVGPELFGFYLALYEVANNINRLTARSHHA